MLPSNILLENLSFDEKLFLFITTIYNIAIMIVMRISTISLPTWGDIGDIVPTSGETNCEFS